MWHVVFTICWPRWQAYGACDVALPHRRRLWGVQWWRVVDGHSGRLWVVVAIPQLWWWVYGGGGTSLMVVMGPCGRSSILVEGPVDISGCSSSLSMDRGAGPSWPFIDGEVGPHSQAIITIRRWWC